MEVDAVTAGVGEGVTEVIEGGRVLKVRRTDAEGGEEGSKVESTEET